WWCRRSTRCSSRAGRPRRHRPREGRSLFGYVGVKFARKSTRATPSPPRSKREKAAPWLGPVGERVGVRGMEVRRSVGPLSPSLSPAPPKRAVGLLHYDRGGEGVTR